MFPLSSLQNSALTDYVIQILQNNGILTVRDFLAADEEKFCKITNLKKKTFYNIKLEMLRKYGPIQSRMSCLYLKTLYLPRFNFSTGISNLDSILKNTAFCGSYLLEVCGLAGAGKTQLCLTVGVNSAMRCGDVLYIDTKAECVGTRIYRMLKVRNIGKTEIGQIMERIKVERTFSVSGILKILNGLLDKLQNKNTSFSEASNIKIVIIDSLPALGLHLMNAKQNINCKYWLTCLANLMRILSSQHFIVFLFVNILVRVELNATIKKDTLADDEQQLLDEDSDSESRDLQHSQPFTNTELRPALGKYWLSVPTMRLSMDERKDDGTSFSTQESNLRILTVLKSCYSCSGERCLVRITNSGVV